MKIIHYFNDKYTVEKEINEEPNFMLTNKLGGYLSLGSLPNSRYQGWFFTTKALADKKLFKIIENIETPAFAKVTEIRNNFWCVTRKKQSLEEKFFIPKSLNSLVYSTSKLTDVEITLDIKESYCNKEEDRHYEIFEEKGVTIVKFQQSGLEVPAIYLAIKAEGQNPQKIESWILRKYTFDQQRNSFPFERYVFKAFKIKSKKIVFAVADDKNQAIREAEYVFENEERLEDLEISELDCIKVNRKIKNKEEALAFICAQNALCDLAISYHKNKGIFAGFPWFFQIWPRDEAMSLKAMQYSFYKEAKDIFLQNLEHISVNGDKSGEADFAGWFFARAEEFIKNYSFTDEEIKEVKKIVSSLSKIIENLLATKTQDGFAMNGYKETWMDSLDRSGSRIEIQALRLSMYRLVYQLTSHKKYLKLESELREKVRRQFYNGNYLADGFYPDSKTADFTIRPNIFIAAYIYPNLLTRKEWIRCFENILPKLYLDWGGLTTIDKKDSTFVAHHTGENSQSYHQGDSWFYLNNLAAMVMYNTHERKFKKYIQQILRTSTQEILWHGTIGCHAELSSAAKFTPAGCQDTAFSAAMYVELANTINKRKWLIF